MPRYDVQFTVTGYVEAESEEKVDKLFQEHLVLYISDPAKEGEHYENADLDPYEWGDLEITEVKE